MPTKFIIYIILTLSAISSIGWFVMDYIDTKEDNAAKTQALVTVTTAYGEYATRVETEVDAWRTNFFDLSNKYQDERNIRNEKFANIEKRDIDKMLSKHPDLTINILNGRTDRMLKGLTGASSIKRNTEDAAASSTGADGT